MNKLMLFAISLFVFAPLARAAETVKMETRIHPVSPYVVGCGLPPGDAGTNAPRDAAATRDAALQTFLERYGMVFSAGAFIRDEAARGRYVLRNTPVEQAKFRRLSTAFEFDYLNRQVAADFSFVAFERAEVERAARLNLSAAPSSEALIALWKAGKGRLVATETIVTRSGVNAQMQAVGEIIYPTEFSSGPAGDTNAPAQVTNPILMPGSFETREIGVIVNFTPTIGPDGRTMDLVIAPEIAELAETNRFTATFGPANDQQRTSAEQPVFRTGKLTTTVAMRDGATLVLGDIAPHGLKERYYLFLTARVVDATGGKPGETDTSILLDEPAKP